ncbi:hypothetical protein C1646_770089 [Rhizophagus diaphanus]|nr:hypothetical protein C1646_770089 [Rhizophagus diaphanus] [Rhizophagus sp. MUCL 43196]
MSWACYRFIAGLSAKRRITKWFQLLIRWIKGISVLEMPRHSLFNFLSNILQPVSEDKQKHPYVIIKNKNNEVSVGFVKKRTQIKKNEEKIKYLIIEVCNIEICSDNSQKASAITHINWYYIVESLNRTKNILINSDIQQLEKTPTINLNEDNLGEFSVYSCLSLWPSLTRAEIVAIFLALLTAPENSNVTIYIDSLGAINSINSAFNSTTRT